MQATLGGGCFWCLDAAFRDIEGVEGVVSGYAGGTAADPTYEAVCSGRTGHAEVVQLDFDPGVITYAEILEIFFTIHDPTTQDRQGADVGSQYRSIILAHDDEQAETAKDVMQDVQSFWKNPIVTDVRSLERFYPAEAHHQDYYARNTSQGYCQAVISPKLAHLRQRWAHRLKSSAS